MNEQNAGTSRYLNDCSVGINHAYPIDIWVHEAQQIIHGYVKMEVIVLLKKKMTMAIFE